jgi:hypothetical protein
MDRETLHEYIKGHRQLVAEAMARESLDVSLEDLEAGAFHQRFAAVVDRFNRLPGVDQESPNRGFSIDVRESKPDATDGGRIMLTYLDWGYETFVTRLEDPITRSSLIEEMLLIDARSGDDREEHLAKSHYDVAQLKQLSRLEQTLTVIEEELARRSQPAA